MLLLTSRLSTPLPELVQPPTPGPDQPFCGPREVLRRLAIVRSGTVVIGWPSSGPPRVRRPGELLVPGRPLAPPVEVLPVTTTPVELLVTVTDLTTADRSSLPDVEVRLRMQLDAAEEFAAALDLAVEYGDRLGVELMQQTLQAVEGAVRAAIRMNRLSDLRRLTLAGVLAARWLPSTYAGGRLRRLDFHVPPIGWPDSAPPPHRPRPALELSVDARLRAIWRAVSDAEPVGIAGAHIGDHATVIVVLRRAPGAEETSRAREGFLDSFGTTAVTVLPVVGDNYRALVESWFAGLDVGPSRVVSVTPDAEGEGLTVTLDRPVARAVGPETGWQGPDGSEVEALRRLLPFRTIRLTYGDGLE